MQFKDLITNRTEMIGGTQWKSDMRYSTFISCSEKLDVASGYA